MDLLSEKYRIFSPYVYANNNPILLIDPDEMAADTSGLEHIGLETISVVRKAADYLSSSEFSRSFGDFMSGGQVSDMEYSLHLYETEGMKSYIYSQIGSAHRDGALSMMGQYRGGKVGNIRKVLSISSRLSMFKDNLLKAKKPKSPKEALKLINKTLDDIEKNHSSASDRMHGILDNKYVTYNSNASVTALTKGHRIEIQSDGPFSIFVRATRKLFFKK